MLNFLKKALGMTPKVNMKELFQIGAQIIDVRTKSEYQSGHIKGSINIPLQSLPNHFSKIKKDKPIITCCASGMRSATAKNLLKSNGFEEVHNGGGWMNLQSNLN